VTGSVAYDAGTGASFDLGGGGVLPIFKGGIGFNLPLIVQGGVIPLMLATQQRMVTLGSFLKALKLDDLYAKQPEIPLLSGNISDLLTIQIRDVDIVFCKAQATNCTTRLSINVEVPANMSRFDSGLLPITLGDTFASVSVLDPFAGGKKRGMELRLVGEWDVGGKRPVPLTVIRAPSNAAVEVAEDNVDDDGDEESRRRRLHFVRRHLVERPFFGGLTVGDHQDLEPLEDWEDIHGSDFAADVVDSFDLDAHDHWVSYPDVGSFSFFNMPLAHVNHHVLTLHRLYARSKTVALDSKIGTRSKTAPSSSPKETKQKQKAAKETGRSAPKSATGAKTDKKKKEAASVRRKPPRKTGLLIPPGAAGKWMVAGTAQSLQMSRLMRSLSLDLFPAGEFREVVCSLSLGLTFRSLFRSRGRGLGKLGSQELPG
jgi:hypothetical protein